MTPEGDNVVTFVSYDAWGWTNYLSPEEMIAINETGVYEFTVSSFTDYTVEFGVPFTLSVVQDGDGTFEIISGPTYKPGENAVIRILSGRVYGVTVDQDSLDEQTVNEANLTGNLEFTINRNTLATIFFGEYYTISASKNIDDGGELYSVGAAPGSVGYTTVATNFGYRISSVSVDGRILTESEIEGYMTEPGMLFMEFPHMDADHSVFVTFEPKYYTIYCEARDYNGTFPDGNSQTVREGSSAEVRINANLGYVITKIYVNGIEAEPISPKDLVTEYVYSVDSALSDMKITADFIPISNVYLKPYSHDVSVRPGGQIDVGIVIWNTNEDVPVRVKMDSVRLFSEKNQEVSFETMGPDSVWVAPGNRSSTPTIGKTSMAIGAPMPGLPQLLVRLTASEFSSGGKAILQMNFIVMENPSAESLPVPERVIMQTCTFAIDIVTGMVQGESFGKVLGIFALSGGMTALGESSAGIFTAMIYAALTLIFAAVIKSVDSKYLPRRHKVGDMHRCLSITLWTILLMFITAAAAHTVFVFGGSYRTLVYARVTMSAILVLLGSGIFYLFFDAASRYLAKKTKDDRESQVEFVAMIAKVAIVLAGVSAALLYFGMDPLSVFAALGILGIALSVGASATLGRVMGGLMVLFSKAYSERQTVRVETLDEPGTVERIGIFSSDFKHWASAEVATVPNSLIAESILSNVTRRQHHQVSVYFYIPYGSDFDEAKKIALATAKANEHVVGFGGGEKNCIRVVNLDESYMTARIVVRTDKFETNHLVAAQLSGDIYDALDKSGIEVPYEVTMARRIKKRRDNK